MKKLIFAFSVILAAVAVNAEAMYWQVSTLQTNAKDYTMAQVRVYQNGAATDNYLSVLDESSGTWSTGGGLVSTSAEGAWFDLTDYTSGSPEYSFVLELVNDNLDVMGSSAGVLGGGPVAYSQLVEKGVVQNFDSIAPLNYTSWNAGFVDIPEPTSALMMLLGASLLALRRKRA